jgi:hypothetical protein
MRMRIQVGVNMNQTDSVIKEPYDESYLQPRHGPSHPTLQNNVVVESLSGSWLTMRKNRSPSTWRRQDGEIVFDFFNFPVTFTGTRTAPRTVPVHNVRVCRSFAGSFYYSLSRRRSSEWMTLIHSIKACCAFWRPSHISQICSLGVHLFHFHLTFCVENSTQLNSTQLTQR